MLLLLHRTTMARVTLRPLPRLRLRGLPPLFAPTPVRRLFVRHLWQVAPHESNYASWKEHLFMDAKSNLLIIPIDDKY